MTAIQQAGVRPPSPRPDSPLDYGRHLPASHPVLRQRPLVGSDDPNITLDLEAIARRTARMPEGPLTVGQRRMVALICEELLRRAGR